MKTRIYRNNEPKLITGVIIDGENVKIPNRQHRNMHIAMELWKKTDRNRLDEKSFISLLSNLAAMGAIDRRYNDKARAVRDHAKEAAQDLKSREVS